ncbi:MAG: hypothetical protein AAFO03_00370, partial [Bacteroidota bacterium]
MEEKILDAEPVAEGRIEGLLSKMILYTCLLVYPAELFMGYRTLAFDYSNYQGDLMFHPAHGPVLTLFVWFMIPLGSLTALLSYIVLRKKRRSSKTVFLLINPIIQFFLYLYLQFLFYTAYEVVWASPNDFTRVYTRSEDG